MMISDNKDLQKEHQALLDNAQASGTGGQFGTVPAQNTTDMGEQQTAGMSTNSSSMQGTANYVGSDPCGYTSAGNTSGTAQVQSREAARQETKTVVAVFENHQQADNSVMQLRQKGFRQEEISVVAKQHQQTDEMGGTYNDSIVDGAATGSALGGIGGLMAAAGALAIPGFGPIIAMGPLAAILGGAVAGGVAGGLVDYGVPADRGKEYEAHLEGGNVLAVIRAEASKAGKAAEIFRQTGALKVETH